MPLIDGVKMACAPCIRGHRSTSCQHADRPLLQVRAKGRPLSQCDHCRDLRKVKQVHVRCNCKPDESQAPKRKGRGKKVITDDPVLCRCDETGLCTCATPRTAHRDSRRSSAPVSVSPISPNASETAPSIPSASDGSEKSWPSCCLNVDPLSDTASLKYGEGACKGNGTGNTSGSESCSTTPPTPSDGSTVRSVNNPPTGFGHFNPEQTQLSISGDDPTLFGLDPNQSIMPGYTLLTYSQPVDDSLQFPLPTRSHRYTPYPTATQPSSSTSYPAPSRTSRSTQASEAVPDFDSETLALWDQFLREDTNGDTTRDNATLSNGFPPLPDTNTSNNDLLSLFGAPPPPPSSCSCSPGSPCGSCSSKDTESVESITASVTLNACTSASCVEFDCATLVAAMALIDEDFPGVEDDSFSALLPVPDSNQNKNPMSSNISLSSAATTTISIPQLMQDPKASSMQAKLQSALSGTCTCMQKCDCFLCRASVSDAPASEAALTSFQNCVFCGNCRDLDRAIASSQKMTVPAIF